MAIADIQRFQEIFPTVKSVLVVLPQGLSVDAVAAGCALSLALNKQGVSTTVSSPAPMTVQFNRLVGVDKIREDLGDKNMILSFTNYPAENIEKVSYNIENNEFTLAVVPKPGNPAPGQEHIRVNYAGVNADLVIAIDVNYPTDLGKFAENKELLERPNIAVLGNAPLSGWPRAIELIDPSGISVSEVVYDLLGQMQFALDEDIATDLLLGLEDGTKNFTSPQVSAETFMKAAELLKAGARKAQPAQTQEQASPFASFNQGSQGTPADVTHQQFRDSTNLG